MGATDLNKKNDINILTEGLIVLSFSKEIAEKSSEIYHELRRKNKIIEFRDIFIAATCIVHDLPVKTNNRKHFERIPGIRFD
jgi:tRNA(fMet)-specific endonuclease VapC